MADAEGTFQGEPTYSARSSGRYFVARGLVSPTKNSHDTWAQAFLNGHLPIARAARPDLTLKANTWLAASYLWLGCAAGRVWLTQDSSSHTSGRLPPNYLRKPGTVPAYLTKLRYEARASI